MSVNSDVYGSPEDWVSFDNYSGYKGATFQNGGNTIGDALETGQLELNTQINDSIAFVGCDGGFEGLKVSYVRSSASFQEADYRKFLNRDIFDIKQDGVYKLMLLKKNDSIYGDTQIYIPNVTDGYNSIWYQDAKNLKSSIQQYTPVTSLGNNANTRLLILIYCVANLTSGTSEVTICDLDEYISDYYESKKYVVGVGCVLLTRKSTDDIWAYAPNAYSYSLTQLPTKKFNWYAYYNSGVQKDLTKYSYSYGHAQTMETPSISGIPSHGLYYTVLPIFRSGINLTGYWTITTTGTGNSTAYIPNIGSIYDLPEDVSFPFVKNGIRIDKYMYNFALNSYETRRAIDLNDTDYWSNDSSKFYEWCKKQAAYFGMFFVTSSNNVLDANDSQNVYLGIMDDYGITHGQYTQGAENVLQNNYDKDIINDIEHIIPDVVQSDKGDLESQLNGYTYGGGARYLVMNDATFRDTIKFLNTTYTPTDKELTEDFKGKNPIDYIISAMKFPFPVPAGNPLPVYIGGLEVKLGGEVDPVKAGIMAREVTTPVSSSNNFFSFGSISINPVYNDFRDFEPYTTCVLQLPFIGDYNVDLKKFMNHAISVSYVVDYMSGDVTALIYLDDLIIDTLDGQIAFPLSLSGISQGDYQNTIQQLQASKRNNTLNGISASVGLIGGVGAVAMASNPIGIAAGVGAIVASEVNIAKNLNERQNIDYQLEHTAPRPSSISVASPLNSFIMDRRARLLFYRSTTPTNFNTEEYAHIMGNVCIKNGTIGQFPGFLVCSNADLSNMPCTEAEKNEILSLLKTGIYV